MKDINDLKNILNTIENRRHTFQGYNNRDKKIIL